MMTKLAPLALVLSMVSLGVSIATLVIFGKRFDEQKEVKDPLGKGMKSYDFTTPKASYLSQLKMVSDRDIRAQLEFESMLADKTLREKISTLEIRREMEDKGGKLLFASYEREGIKKYEVVKFEKDAETGLWRTRGTTFRRIGEVQSDSEKKLQQEIEGWEKDGTVK